MKKITIKKQRSGFTLIEILVSVLILALLALGGGSILYQAGSAVVVQKNKRVAIEAVSRRLEQISAEPYSNIRPGSSGVYYLNSNNNVVSSNPDETVSINGRQRSIITAVERITAYSPDREYVQVTARVQYRMGDNWVSATTNLR